MATARKVKAQPVNQQVSSGEARNAAFKYLKDKYKKNSDVVLVEDYLKTDDILGWAPTGCFMLDLAVGYPTGLGLPMPAVVEIVGEVSTAISWWAYPRMGNVQEQGGWAMLIDTEASFSKTYAKLAKLDVHPDKLLVLQLEYIEDAFDIIKDTIEKHFEIAKDKPLVICLDSVAGTTTRQEKEASGEPARASHSRIISRKLREGLTRLISDKKCLILFINQLRATMATFPGAAKLDSFGGFGLKYYSRVRLKIDRTGSLKDKPEDKTPRGIRCRIETLKNKIAAPHRKVEMDVRFATGIEDYYSVINFLESNGCLEKSGNRFIWGDKSYFPKQFRDLMISDFESWVKLKTMAVDAAKLVWTEPPLTPEINRSEAGLEYDSDTGEVYDEDEDE